MRNNHGGGYQYRLCPLPEGNFTELTEACFQEHPLDFVEDEQSIVFPDGKTLKLTANQTTFVKEGTHPAGSTWSMIPMPPTLLGPCCLPGPNDNATTPNHCLAKEASYCGAADEGDELGESVEGVWKPNALTKDELTAILGALAGKPVVDQDDQTYDYLHPVTLQKAQMVAFSTDPKMVRANQKYAERADEFFWRRAPAVFTPAGQRVVTKAGQADHRRAVMRNARANAQGSVKIIDLGEGLKPWTQKHFEQYVKHTGLAEEWHSYGEAGACRRVTAAAVAQAKHREEAYEQQLMREVLNKQIAVQEELIAERPRHPRAKLNKLRAELEKFEADILAMWVGRIPGAGAY